MTAERSAKPQTFHTLDAMRGVAALAVVCYHGAGLFGPVVHCGYLAVDLFFLLSGFVISHAYDGRLGRGMGAREFIKIRLIRFYPLFAAGILLGAAVEVLLIATHNSFALSPPTLAAVLAASALFIPFPLARRDYNLFPVNVPSWSLFYELAVNFIYAMVFPYLSMRILAVVLVASGCALILLLPTEGVRNVGATAPHIAAAIARTLFSFTFGVLLYRSRLRTIPIPVPLLLLATACALALARSGARYDLAFIFVVSPILVALGSSVQPNDRLIAVSRRLGLLSFPIYAIHRPILALAEAFAKIAHLNPIAVGVATVAAIVMFCAFVADPLDRRARTWLSRLTATRSDPAAAAAP